VAVAVPIGCETVLNRRTVVALALLLVLAACGGTEDNAGTGSTTGTNTPSDTTTPSGKNEPVPGVPWGPNDPPIPGQYAALAVSSTDNLDCDAVGQQAPDSDFWATVVEVCRALKGDAEWPTSGSLDPPPAENGYQDCLNRELATMLEALFEWRDEHPGAEPKVAYPPGSARSPCTLHVYDASAFSVSPDASHPTGGVVVELYVAALDEGDSPEVLVDGEPVEVLEDFSGGGDGLLIGEVFIPAPIDAHEATIVVKADFGDVTGAVLLPDVQLSTESGSQTGSPTTTTS
jgi:hypothetical protein